VYVVKLSKKKPPKFRGKRFPFVLYKGKVNKISAKLLRSLEEQEKNEKTLGTSCYYSILILELFLALCMMLYLNDSGRSRTFGAHTTSCFYNTSPPPSSSSQPFSSFPSLSSSVPSSKKRRVLVDPPSSHLSVRRFHNNNNTATSQDRLPFLFSSRPLRNSSDESTACSQTKRKLFSFFTTRPNDPSTEPKKLRLCPAGPSSSSLQASNKRKTSFANPIQPVVSEETMNPFTRVLKRSRLNEQHHGGFNMYPCINELKRNRDSWLQQDRSSSQQHPQVGSAAACSNIGSSSWNSTLSASSLEADRNEIENEGGRCVRLRPNPLEPLPEFNSFNFWRRSLQTDIPLEPLD
jgi:hypothetical protein